MCGPGRADARRLVAVDTDEALMLVAEPGEPFEVDRAVDLDGGALINEVECEPDQFDDLATSASCRRTRPSLPPTAFRAARAADRQ
jgi:hypothetical protein